MAALPQSPHLLHSLPLPLLLRPLLLSQRLLLPPLLLPPLPYLQQLVLHLQRLPLQLL
jgi:hypothetical protein